MLNDPLLDDADAALALPSRRPVLADDKPVPLDFIPQNPRELARCLNDAMWRICSGQLYQILIKSPVEGTTDAIIPFKPNRSQRRFIKRMWHRNLILKARQLGFTTLICLIWLDHALFVAYQRCGIVAHDRDSAEAIFRDKVKFAYDHLPDAVRVMFPLKGDNANELVFAHNNSLIRVGTSLRSGTYHRVLVSEFGKICAKYPEKAAEVVTGTLPSVPLQGIAVIESTAEGQDGDFYKMTQRAINLQDQGVQLTVRDYKFHFAPWHADPNYMIPEGEGHVVVGFNDTEYFDRIEAELGITLTMPQRRWYVATRDAEFSGDPEKMWREYPSTPKEAFQVSTEGKWFSTQMTEVRKRGGICDVPLVEGIPVNTFWDIGNTDGTAVWLHQRVGLQDRFIDFIEGWGEPYAYFLKRLQDMKLLWGTHYVPHDANHERQQLNELTTPLKELKKGGIAGDWLVVPVVSDIITGIQLARNVFSQCVFDKTKCKAGIIHLDGYSKVWNQRHACWSSTPKKDDGHSEAADAFRQFAQSQARLHITSSGSIGYSKPRRSGRIRDWKTS